VHGRAAAPDRHRRVGYDHLEVFVDDRSRVAAVVPVPDESPAAAARALELVATGFAREGVRIERVLTDNGGPYRSRVYRATVEALGIRHKRTQPYRPQTNGKVERFVRTPLAEWAYGRPYTSNDERLAELSTWLGFYNHERPHTAWEAGRRWPSFSTTSLGSTPSRLPSEAGLRATGSVGPPGLLTPLHCQAPKGVDHKQAPPGGPGWQSGVARRPAGIVRWSPG